MSYITRLYITLTTGYKIIIAYSVHVQINCTYMSPTQMAMMSLVPVVP